MKNKIKLNERNYTLGSIIQKSVRGFTWIEKEVNNYEAKELSKRFSIDEFFANILLSRGVNSKNFKDFNEPKLKNILPNPSILKDLDASTKLIVEFILKKKKNWFIRRL